MYNIQCTTYIVKRQCKMYNVKCTMYNVQGTMYKVQCTNIDVQILMYKVPDADGAGSGGPTLAEGRILRRL